LLLFIPVLIGISIVTFSLLRLIPGDPARVMLGERATPKRIEEFREKMVAQAGHFARCIEGNRKPITNGQERLRNLVVALAPTNQFAPNV